MFVINFVKFLVSVQQLLEWNLTAWGLRLYVLCLLCLSGITDLSASAKRREMKPTFCGWI